MHSKNANQEDGNRVKLESCPPPIWTARISRKFAPAALSLSSRRPAYFQGNLLVCNLGRSAKLNLFTELQKGPIPFPTLKINLEK